MQPSSSFLSRPVETIGNKVMYSQKIITKGPVTREEMKGFTKKDKYDVVRTSKPVIKVNVYPDGEPILLASDLPCLSKKGIARHNDSISVERSTDQFLKDRVFPEGVRLEKLLKNPERQRNVESQVDIQVPVFLPPLQVGTHYLDPQQIPEQLTDQEAYALQTQSKFWVGPGNPSCVDCNLRLQPCILLSGYGPISTLEGEKPLLFPQVTTAGPTYAPMSGVAPDAQNSLQDSTDLAKEIREQFAVKNVPSPPSFAFHDIIYETVPGGCDTPRAIGAGHGNLVERGMSVCQTLSS